ncbi:hypothetical protein AALP_AA8G199300 [Arabis alpina]|uniref:RING-type E3 ubiquitin transferase n=1 Tax=Arabis alpina TaxID=50452 RepID=A0A087G869_ARAAL|nr:hypothetical protein AALP_AA8G199300 [Arabis alpina]
MADSTADEMTETAVTLRRELKELLTENFYDGGDRGDSEDGSFVDLKTIDEAIRVLTCLKEVESKNPESDNSSSSSTVEVPEEFKCLISKDIMIKPVLIASGETFEERYISQYLQYERICPKTKELLSNCIWTPNHLVDELITQWCQLNNYDRPKPSDVTVTELFPNDINSLLDRISSPSSLEDQEDAARELRNQTKKFVSVRYFFVAQVADSITRLLSPLSALGNAVVSNPELQENLVTTLFNISVVDQHKYEIARHPLVIPLLGNSLFQGTAETRRNSAATLRSLALFDSNRYMMADSEALKDLIRVIGNGDNSVTLEAGSAIMYLCFEQRNMKKAISAGFIQALTKEIKAERNVADLLPFLVSLSTSSLAVEKMQDLGFIDDLFKILRKPSCSVTGKNALEIVYNMGMLPTNDRYKDSKRLELINEEENKYGTFLKIAKEGSDREARIAQSILQWHKSFGTGKKPIC